jgi:Mn2+/Fe2+ NRAMP family transporter
MDPGNWATGLAAGSGWGYAHLFIVLVSSLIGMFLQALAVRLGVCGGRDLAQACASALPRWARLLLWASAEAAMVATDLAEVIGFAVALRLLTGWPAWAGVALAAGDTLLMLALPAGRFGARLIELLALLLVLVIALCFLVQLVVAAPSGAAIGAGLLPSAVLVSDTRATLVAVGILGATVMPHNLYLHSALVRTRRVREEGEGEGAAGGAPPAAAAAAAPGAAGGAADAAAGEPAAAAAAVAGGAPLASPAAEPESGEFEVGADASGGRLPGPRAHPAESWQQTLAIAVADSCLSLAGALAINSSIVIVAAAVFHPQVAAGALDPEDAASLEGAYRLLQPALGPAAATLYAVALLCSGQSSTFTGTMAGGVVMDGFLSIRLQPWLRRLLTRGAAIVPAAVVVAALGERGLDDLLIFSQVTLAFQLPFAVFPLVYFTASKTRLGPYALSAGAAALGWGIAFGIVAMNLFLASNLFKGH